MAGIIASGRTLAPSCRSAWMGNGSCFVVQVLALLALSSRSHALSRKPHGHPSIIPCAGSPSDCVDAPPPCMANTWLGGRLALCVPPRSGGSGPVGTPCQPFHARTQGIARSMTKHDIVELPCMVTCACRHAHPWMRTCARTHAHPHPYGSMCICLCVCLFMRLSMQTQSHTPLAKLHKCFVYMFSRAARFM